MAAAADVAVLQRYARAAGVAMLLSLVFGMIGELYLPGRIVVAGDAAATAANLTRNPMLLRLALASYLVEAFCDTSCSGLSTRTSRPQRVRRGRVDGYLRRRAVELLRLVARPPAMLSFSLEQRQALAFLCIRIATMIAWLFVGFYGTASMIRGYLIARSGYLPKVLGILLMIGGAGFFLRSVTYILAPSLSSPLLLLPMALAGIPFTFWLLFRGVRVE